MEKLLLFSGTTEGKKLSECLAQNGYCVTLCVATEYGEKVLPQNKAVQVQVGRMDTAQIAAFIRENNFSRVVDATHPYAAVVSSNIFDACAQEKVEYLRLLRSARDFSDVVEGRQEDRRVGEEG